MSEKGGFGSLFDLASLVLDIITLGKIKGKDGETKQILSPEQLEAIAKRLAPKIGGAGLADESLFNVALSRLEDRRNIKISRFLETLSKADKSRFILAVSILPEEKDRITVLNMYSELSLAEMAQVAKATRMIKGDKGVTEKMGVASKKAAEEIGKFLIATLWPFIKKAAPKIDQYAAKLAPKIEDGVKNPSRFGRLANRLFR